MKIIFVLVGIASVAMGVISLFAARSVMHEQFAAITVLGGLGLMGLAAVLSNLERIAAATEHAAETQDKMLAVWKALRDSRRPVGKD